MESGRKVPSLVELCRDTAIANLRFIGDVGDVDLHLLSDILPHCNIKELTHIENSTENANAAINRMKQKKVAFKWRLLYEEKEKELDEAIKRAAMKIGAEIRARRGGKRQIPSCSEDPPSKKKRGHPEGIGPGSVKSFLMKVAKMEDRNSHEVKIHAPMRRNALQANSLSHQSIPKQNSILQSGPDSSSRNGKL
ncbi:RNA polymerase II transcription factor SIII (Elongin) subunit A [Musa troglodytarum]|uniref:RNA polymerase II transcription factor SIII (Elongin) subunit A n=1 Tax=Musa troglodytarum TaxID=320322 RepID=A0A9E7G9R9_9LILI|nr:RNA polymerase II transcription factor SIII (Elongin) subunit A [Musa troglodytarum]